LNFLRGDQRVKRTMGRANHEVLSRTSRSCKTILTGDIGLLLASTSSFHRCEPIGLIWRGQRRVADLSQCYIALGHQFLVRSPKPSATAELLSEQRRCRSESVCAGNLTTSPDACYRFRSASASESANVRPRGPMLGQSVSVGCVHLVQRCVPHGHRKKSFHSTKFIPHLLRHLHQKIT